MKEFKFKMYVQRYFLRRDLFGKFETQNKIYLMFQNDAEEYYRTQ